MSAGPVDLVERRREPRLSTSLRCWIAGGALVASALVLGTRSPVGDLAGWGPAALMVVLVNAWVVAVGERAAAPRGLRTPRFPLGRRLLTVEPSMGGAGLFVLGLVALCTRSWEVTAWIALILSILGVEAMRRAAWYRWFPKTRPQASVENSPENTGVVATPT